MASVTAPTAGPARANPARRNYAHLVEQTWIWSMVGYSLLRFFIAWGAFSEHGANIWVFGLVDVGTAWPYGKSVAVVCKRAARSDWKHLPLPLVAAITTFFAPYAYLWFAAGEMPAGMRLGMAICVSVLLVAASVGVLAKTRKLRLAARTTATGTTGLRTFDLRTTVEPTVESAVESVIESVTVIIDVTDSAATGHTTPRHTTTSRR